MFPNLTAHNQADVTLANSILTSNAGLKNTCCIQPTYFQDSVLSKFGVTMRGTMRGVTSTLGFPILGIIGTSAKKQMLGVSTGRVVASVKNKQSFRDWPIVEFIRKAMRSDAFALHRHTPVALTVTTKTPLPAIVRRGSFDDMLPEPLCGSGFPRRAVVASDKGNGLAFHIAALSMAKLGNGGGVATATFAQFRAFRYTVHVIASLSGDSQSPAVHTCAGLFVSQL